MKANKQGYKRTKLGWIPEDWEVKKLGEIAYIDKNNLDSNTLPDYVFYYISLSDVEKGKLINEPKKFVRQLNLYTGMTEEEISTEIKNRISFSPRDYFPCQPSFLPLRLLFLQEF